MPRKSKTAQNAEESPETPRENELEVIQEEKPKKPKRKCTEKQLAALAAGRAKNPRFKPKAKPVVEQAPAPEQTNEVSKEDGVSNQCQE